MAKNKKTKKEDKEVTEALEELNEDGEKLRPTSFWKAAGLFVLEVGKVILISLAIIIPIRYYLIQPFYVKGASMEPTFHDYEYLIIDEISYRFKGPSRGDIIVLKDPRNESQFFIKRVIGLPGEEITIKNGEIMVKNDDFPQGMKIDETFYLNPDVKTQGNEDLKLNADEYYVLGDNRGASLDSRIIGPIQRKDIIGKAWIRAWPFNKIEHFEPPEYNLRS